MSDLLLELFSEEIPARMQTDASKQLEEAVCKGLKEAGLTFEAAKNYSTPRRIALHVTGLPLEQSDLREERKGPRVGAPDKAIEGFLRGAGVASIDECETRSDKKGEYYVAVIERKGGNTADVIATLVPEVVRGFHWPKSMKWGNGSLRWVRPLHSILCTLDGKVVPFDVDGIQSDDQTFGHRFHAPKAISAPTIEKYLSGLAGAHVILRRTERKAKIREEAQKLAAKAGLEVKDDPALYREVCGLVEWPVVLMGSFDQAFLDVPPEVLITAMRSHQKYFALRDPKTGELANKFIFVANLEAEDGGKAIAQGNERVLHARLSDAKFFWDQDKKQTLESRVEKLKDIVFYDKLGTVYDKVQRVKSLARDIAPHVKADPDKAGQSALLCKTDLVTDMVYEFPELQGIMGRYYALEREIDADIADAIRDHYAPQGPSDDCPSAPVSVAVALADKLDTLMGFWVIQQKPTGSKDPFALRRAALGVVRLILENKQRIGLAQVYGMHEGRVRNDAVIEEEESVVDSMQSLLEFFADRMKVVLRDRGIRHDLIDAVFALGDQDDLVAIVARVEALGAFLDTEDGQNLLAGYKRAVNILRIEEKKHDEQYTGTADETLLTEPAEKALFEAIAQADTVVRGHLEREDFTGAMTAVAKLRGPVDQFFDDVKVNDDNAEVRENRLKLLSQIRASLEGVADFSKIEG